MSVNRLPKRVRITQAFDDYKVGDEVTVVGVVKAAGLTFYPVSRTVTKDEELLYGDKCEVIEYHE